MMSVVQPGPQFQFQMGSAPVAPMPIHFPGAPGSEGGGVYPTPYYGASFPPANNYPPAAYQPYGAPGMYPAPAQYPYGGAPVVGMGVGVNPNAYSAVDPNGYR